MSGYSFSLKPKKVPCVRTKYRTIKTKIPAPGSLPVFMDLEKYEARSMHGQLPVVWDRARDFRVFDKCGNSWIDFTSTIFVTNTGHANERVIRALRRQLDGELIHTYTFANRIRAKFLKKLIEISPPRLRKAFLLSAGTEATECAIKLMRMHGQTLNPDKVAIVSFKGSMHGRTMASEMLKGDPGSSGWIGYRDPNMFHLEFPFPWIFRGNWHDYFNDNMEKLKGRGLNFKKIAGFMIESYQGWSATFYPAGYIRELFRFARKHKVLVAFDDIQGGFGRTGELFAYQHYNVTPDLVCIGKGLSGGIPMSAVLGRRHIMDLPETGSMSSTHSANPMSCAGALANIEELMKKNLIARSRRKGKVLMGELLRLKDKYPDLISHVSGKGLLAALIITNPRTQKPDSSLASRLCERAMQKGLLLAHTGRESIKIGPPLTIPSQAIYEGAGVLDECFAELGRC